VSISHIEAQIGRKGIHKSRHTKTLHIIYHLDERKKKSGNKKENKVKEKRNNYKDIKEKGGLY
jgi:hypothetical protein